MAGLPFNAKGWNAKSDSRVLGCWGNWGFGGIGLLMYEFFCGCGFYAHRFCELVGIGDVDL